MQHKLLFALIIVISSVAAVAIPSKEPPTSRPVVSSSVGQPQSAKHLKVRIWYQRPPPASLQPLGLFQQRVAPKGAPSGDRLPLVLISHGVSGSQASHYDTALALAQAGFVVAALTHTGDNSQDQSYVGNQRDLIDRPRQINRVLDFILGAWPEHSRLDPTRVGIF